MFQDISEVARFGEATFLNAIVEKYTCQILKLPGPQFSLHDFISKKNEWKDVSCLNDGAVTNPKEIDQNTIEEIKTGNIKRREYYEEINSTIKASIKNRRLKGLTIDDEVDDNDLVDISSLLSSTSKDAFQDSNSRFEVSPALSTTKQNLRESSRRSKQSSSPSISCSDSQSSNNLLHSCSSSGKNYNLRSQSSKGLCQASEVETASSHSSEFLQTSSESSCNGNNPQVMPVVEKIVPSLGVLTDHSENAVTSSSPKESLETVCHSLPLQEISTNKKIMQQNNNIAIKLPNGKKKQSGSHVKMIKKRWKRKKLDIENTHPISASENNNSSSFSEKRVQAATQIPSSFSQTEKRKYCSRNPHFPNVEQFSRRNPTRSCSKLSHKTSNNFTYSNIDSLQQLANNTDSCDLPSICKIRKLESGTVAERFDHIPEHDEKDKSSSIIEAVENFRRQAISKINSVDDSTDSPLPEKRLNESIVDCSDSNLLIKRFSFKKKSSHNSDLVFFLSPSLSQGIIPLRDLKTYQPKAKAPKSTSKTFQSTKASLLTKDDCVAPCASESIIVNEPDNTSNKSDLRQSPVLGTPNHSPLDLVSYSAANNFAGNHNNLKNTEATAAAPKPIAIIKPSFLSQKHSPPNSISATNCLLESEKVHSKSRSFEVCDSNIPSSTKGPSSMFKSKSMSDNIHVTPLSIHRIKSAHSLNSETCTYPRRATRLSKFSVQSCHPIVNLFPSLYKEQSVLSNSNKQEHKLASCHDLNNMSEKNSFDSVPSSSVREKSKRLSLKENSERLSLKENSERLSLKENSERPSLKENSERPTLRVKSAVLSEREKSEVLPEGEKSEVLFEGEKSEVLPEGEMSEVLPVGEMSEVLFKGEKSEVLFEGEKSEVLPEGEKSEVLPEGEKSEVLPEGEKSEVLPEGEKSEVLPEGKKSEILPEGKKSEILPEGKKSEVLPEGEKSEVLPEGENSEVLPEGEMSEVFSEKENSDVSSKRQKFGKSKLLKKRFSDRIRQKKVTEALACNASKTSSYSDLNEQVMDKNKVLNHSRSPKGNEKMEIVSGVKASVRNVEITSKQPNSRKSFQSPPVGLIKHCTVPESLVNEKNAVEKVNGTENVVSKALPSLSSSNKMSGNEDVTAEFPSKSSLSLKPLAICSGEDGPSSEVTPSCNPSTASKRRLSFSFTSGEESSDSDSDAGVQEYRTNCNFMLPQSTIDSSKVLFNKKSRLSKRSHNFSVKLIESMLDNY